MKSLVFSFLLICSFVFVAQAAVSRGTSDEGGPEGQCYIKSSNIIIPNGEKLIKDCTEYDCSYPDYFINTCGVAVITGPDGKSCRAAEDLSKPYPDCCISDKCVE